MVKLGSFGATVALPIAIASGAFEVSYDGTTSPADVGLEFIVFGGTTWNNAGGSLNLTTAPVRGIWFGARSGNAFAPESSANGNYLRLDVRMGAGAEDWSAYLFDGTHGASFGFDHDGFTYSTAAGGGGVAMDLTADFVTFEFLLLDGRVSYRVNGQVIANRVAAGASTNARIMLIGDGSGSTPTGTGSMSIDNVTYTGTPDFDAIPTPGVAGVLAMTGVLTARRRR
jgi:hypothetical protein